MRIGIVCPYNYFIPGGVQEHVRAQAKELTNRGHFVRIITPRPRQYHGDAPKGVVFIGQSRRIRAQSTAFDVTPNVEIPEIQELYNDLKLDVVHFHEPFIPFLLRQLVLYAPCPVVASFHAAMPETIVSRTISSLAPYLKPVLDQTDKILAVSPAATEQLRGIHEGEVTYIPNGIDLHAYKDRKVERDPATIVFIGRLEKRKGARYLIDAFAQLKATRPDAILKIAGDGNLRKSLERYCLINNISDVQFLGFISEEEKQHLLSTCTLFCSPALYGESFGIVLLEAMALGAPIVAHANPGYSWVLKETGRLSLVNVEDTIEFARRLELLMEDASIRKTWLVWSKEYVKQFSYKQIVSEYEKVYTELVES